MQGCDANSRRDAPSHKRTVRARARARMWLILNVQTLAVRLQNEIFRNRPNELGSVSV
jgi:hypothetical protein